MDEQNDYFDEFIDDESEQDDDELMFEDEEDEDEDEFSEVRTVLMSKDGMIALLSLKTSPAGGQIVRIDPRQAIPSARSYEDSDAAALWFKRSLMSSRKNGWDVAYDGEPLYG